jgi:chromosome segregation ATPase
LTTTDRDSLKQEAQRALALGTGHMTLKATDVLALLDLTELNQVKGELQDCADTLDRANHQIEMLESELYAVESENNDLRQELGQQTGPLEDAVRDFVGKVVTLVQDA